MERERRGEAQQEEVEMRKEEVKEARKEWKRERKRWEKEWWEEVMVECERAANRGDTGAMYKALEKLGKRGIKKVSSSTTITKEQFKDHFSKVSAERFENPPEDIDRTVDQATDLRTDPRTEEWRERLGRPPEREEVINEMKKMKDGAPGEDGARISYILKGGGKVLDEIVELVKFMWENGADKWEESLKRGIIIPLFKKGDRNDPNNYRGVCLLPMGRRIVARISATRLKRWAEAMGLLDDNQAGFRQGRSTADATQIMMRLQEDAVDLKKRREESGGESMTPSARLLDLRKAYPRVNKTALWRLLKRYGLDGNFLRLLIDLHETTEYVVRGREGNSEGWVPERGLTEGCPSSPDLFNIYHQAVMRVAERLRTERAEAQGLTAGIVYKWIPGSNFPPEKSWEKENSEAVELTIEKSLFADDTTIVGDKEEIEEGVGATKEVMASFEERNNDGKEEELDFGEESAEGVRMLGCWMGWKKDIDNRIARAGKAWFRLKMRLVGSTLSKKMQARIVETCVESALLFDCHTRVWYVSELKRLQKFMDRKYRYVWSRKTKPPLIQMEEEGKKMEDVRAELGVKSVRWKVEKRALERLGHVMRMDDSRMTKAVCLGWMGELEKHDKASGKSRKTVLYWKKLAREAGMDVTNIGNLTQDKKKWKALVQERMKHLDEWERSKGHNWQGARKERNKVWTDGQFVCDVCGRVCKSKGGLVNHRRRIHEVSKLKKKFECTSCKEIFMSEANLLNHKKVCGRAVASVAGRRRCICGKEYSVNYLRQHRKKCETWLADQTASPPTAAGPAPRTDCPSCGVFNIRDTAGPDY